MATFCAGIVSCVLVVWPVIFVFFFHREGVITKTDNHAMLSWFAGFIFAVGGLIFPKENSKGLQYCGRAICVVVVVAQLIGIVCFFSSCVKNLSNLN